MRLTEGDLAIFAAMGNDFFRFKQFEVQQKKAAMKVCTDGCLFGALLPEMEPKGNLNERLVHVLDIGTGTGLLSLMYAQRVPDAEIEAIELDAMAFEQARENFMASPWRNRLKAIKGDFKEVRKIPGLQEGLYDLIFSNPPFFEGDLKSADDQRNRALHSTDLSFGELITGVASLLKDDGVFAVLIPFARSAEFIKIAEAYGLYPYRHYKVANMEQKPFFRSILLFCREAHENQEEALYIRDAKQEYSLKFKILLEPFYLYL